MFVTPNRHIVAQNREFWRILRQNPSRGLGCSELQEPKQEAQLVLGIANRPLVHE